MNCTRAITVQSPCNKKVRPRLLHPGRTKERRIIMPKETSYRVDCLEYYRPDTVHIYLTTYNDNAIADFFGCELYDPDSASCDECRKAAQSRFTSQHPELQSIHWRKL